jgi:hypothetical protein
VNCIVLAEFGDNPVDFLLSFCSDEAVVNISGDDDPFVGVRWREAERDQL